MYSCGPTVYDHIHIGNLRAYLLPDLLTRLFLRYGYKVKSTINFTDFGHLTDDADAGEDKMMKGMRREGYEVQISQPNVIIKEENGQKLEPFEEITIDIPEEMSGAVISKISKRRGAVMSMKPDQGHIRIIAEIPTRGFLGYRGEFVVDTKGEGILCSRVIGFNPHVGEIEKHDTGSMISMIAGKALGFALYNLQERGTLYIGANVEVYEGMVIGNVSKGEEMAVNPIKGKQLTNMRSKSSDEAIMLIPPLDLTLERGLEIMKEDEYLEITPKSVRLRKQLLSGLDRVRADRKKE